MTFTITPEGHHKSHHEGHSHFPLDSIRNPQGHPIPEQTFKDIYSPGFINRKPKENPCKNLDRGKKYIISDAGGMLARSQGSGLTVGSNQSVRVHGEHGYPFAKSTFEPFGDKCAIKSHINFYIGRCNGSWKNIQSEYSLFNHLGTPGQTYSLWTVERYRDLYAFKADTGKYIARCRYCVKGVANRDFAFVHIHIPTGPALWRIESA